MGKVISFADKKFEKVDAAKILRATSAMDQLFEQLVIHDNVKAHELVAAMCQRIGVYISYTDADREKVVKKLSSIIYKHAAKR